MLDDDGKINENGGKYQGLDRYEARKAIVADLEEQGYLIKIEDYNHNVGSCYRCGTTIVMVTHEHEMVKYFGGRTINIENGVVVFDDYIGGANESK